MNYSKEASSRLKHLKKASLKKIEGKSEESLIRRKRTPNEFNEENTNFYLNNNGI